MAPEEREILSDRLNAAELILREKEALMTKWIAEVRASLPDAANESTVNLTDSVPQLIDIVAKALQQGSIAGIQGEIAVSSAEHGHQRAHRTHYELEELISEYQILRRILVACLFDCDCLTPEVHALVEGAIDSYIRRSATEYMEELLREYRRVEEQLRYRLQTEWEMLSAVIDKMPVGVIIAEARTGRFLLHNREAVSILGHPITAGAFPRGSSEYGALHEDGTPYAIEDYPVIRAALKGESIPDHVQIYRRGDGRVTHLSVSAAPVRDPNGRPKYAVTVFRDIDLKVRDARRLGETLTELRAERDVRERFVATLSHDLRNPLSAAGMNLQLLRRHSGDAEMVSRLSAKGLANLARVDRMVNDLLDAGRLRAGQGFPVHREPCELAGLTRSVAEELGLVHGARFRVDAPDSVLGEWDCRALRRILENLCTNAVKYGSAGTPIDIRLRREADSVTLSVHNSGSEIPAAQREAIFDPFRRLEPGGESAPQSWGLGLGTGGALCGTHHGRVTVESAPGEGTTFSVALPLSSERKSA